MRSSGGGGRRSPEAEELAATARRRLAVALGPPPPEVTGGWVPQRPADPEPAGGRRRVTAAVVDRVPVGLRSMVLAPSGRAVVGLLLVVAAAVAATGATAWLTRPQERVVPDRRPLLGEPLSSPTTAAPRQGGGVLLVHVAGAVRRPGLVELPAGARVADAVEAAGGVTRRGDAASVNLARLAVDGEQVVVARRGVAGAAVPAPGAAPAVSGVPTGPVDLNTATLEQLDGLPGIGPVLAQRILDWRAANGRFSVVDELGEVSGIGEATLADLRPLVTV